MEKKRFYRNKILWKVLVILLVAIGLAILLYIFALPKYAEYRIKNAEYIHVRCGDIMFGMDEDEGISAIMQSIDIPAWQRRMTKPERKDKQGLPSMYITVDNKYDMNFWVFEETCYVHVFYHSSGIEIGIYEMGIEKYYECVANLETYYNNLPGLEEAEDTSAAIVEKESLPEEENAIGSERPDTIYVEYDVFGEPYNGLAAHYEGDGFDIYTPARWSLFDSGLASPIKMTSQHSFNTGVWIEYYEDEKLSDAEKRLLAEGFVYHSESGKWQKTEDSIVTQVGLIAQRDDVWAICSVYDEAYETSTSVDMVTDTFAITGSIEKAPKNRSRKQYLCRNFIPALLSI